MNMENEKAIELVQRFRDGDLSAYRELQLAYEPYISQIVSEAIGDHGDSLANPEQVKAKINAEFPQLLLQYDPQKGQLNTFLVHMIPALAQNAVLDQINGFIREKHGVKLRRTTVQDAIRNGKLKEILSGNFESVFPPDTDSEGGISLDKHQLALALHMSMLRVNALCIAKYASPLLGYVRPPEDLVRYEFDDLMDMYQKFYAMGDTIEQTMLPADVEKIYSKIGWVPVKVDLMTSFEHKVIDDYNAGLPVARIALQHGISTTKIRAILDKYNIQLRYEQAGQMLEGGVIADYKAGLSLEQISKNHDMSVGLIRKILEAHNVPVQLNPDTPPTLVQRYQAGSPEAKELLSAECEPIIAQEAAKWAEFSGLAVHEIKETIESHLPRWLMQKNEGPNWAGLESYLAYCIAEEVGKNLRKRKEDGECYT